MISKAATVEQYLASLPEDRRAAIAAIRKVILDNLDKGVQETIQYGMIGYSVPHSVYPPGYHCDPRQPLPYAGLASQKGHMSLYLFSIYTDSNLQRWFHQAWRASGKKLDMGKACIRFKRLEDVPLEVIGEVIRRVPTKAFIAGYEAGLAGAGRASGKSGGGKAKAAASKKKEVARRGPAAKARTTKKAKKRAK